MNRGWQIYFDMAMRPRPPVMDATRARFYDDVFSLFQNRCNGEYAVMVMDKRAARVMSAVLTLSDILDRYEVAMIESLVARRKPLPGIPALYFVEPTVASVAQIVADFSGDAPMYKCALIVFTRTIPRDVAEVIRASPKLRMRALCVVEAQIDFTPLESHVVLLGGGLPAELRPSPPLNVFRMAPETRALYNETIAGRLATLFVSLGENPLIKVHGFCKEEEEKEEVDAIKKTNLAMEFALQVQQSMKEYYNVSKATPATTRRATLLVVDRMADMSALALHEFSYQSFLHDALHSNINDHHTQVEYTAAGADPAPARLALDEDDPFWTDIRHLHISDVSRFLSEFATENLASSHALSLARSNASAGSRANVDDDGTTLVGAGQALTTKQLAEVMKQMPDFKATFKSHAGHTHLALLLTRLYVELNLGDLSSLEQTIVTGVDEDGRKVSRASELKLLLGVLETLLPRAEGEAGRGNTIDTENLHNAIRLVVVYVAEHGMSVAHAEWEAIEKVWGATDGSLAKLRARLVINMGLVFVNAPSKKKKAKRDLSEAAAKAKANTYTTREREPFLSSIVRHDALGLDEDASAVCLHLDGNRGASGAARRGGRIPQSTRKDFVPVSLRGKEEEFLGKAGAGVKRRRGGGRGGAARSTTCYGAFAPRIFVYVVGGFTPSECRAVYDLQRQLNRDITLVGPDMLSPRVLPAWLLKEGEEEEEDDMYPPGRK